MQTVSDSSADVVSEHTARQGERGEQGIMGDDKPALGKRRRVFFGRDPLAGLVFSLDTSRQELPQHLLRKLHCISAAVSPAQAVKACDAAGMHNSSTTGVGFSSEDVGQIEGIHEQRAKGNAEDSTAQHEVSCSAGCNCQQAALGQYGGCGDLPHVGDESTSHEGGPAGTATRRCLLAQAHVGNDGLKSTAQNPVTPRIAVESLWRTGSVQQNKAATETPTGSCMTTQGRDTPPPWSGRPKEKEGKAVPLDTAATVAEGQCFAGRTGNTIDDANMNGPVQESRAVSAVSMIASFLKEGTAPVPAEGLTPSPIGQRFHSFSRPSSSTMMPLPLASLVAAAPLGSHSEVKAEGSDLANDVVPRASAEIPSPSGTAGGGSRFLNDEWPPRLKERRRIVRFPKRSEPAGTRILYWVRGNYRVRDNLALSVAMWLSTELRMPLEAVTFVDPAIGRSAPSDPSDGQGQTPSGVVQGHDIEQQLPFRTAVEASALCEMEQALQALNIPLVAIACIESEVPEYLVGWCNGSAGGDSKSGAATSTSTAAAATAAAAAVVKPPKGRVHVAITDESYHPRQLWLAEKAGLTLPGVALYAVDSSCICSVNNFKGTKQAAATHASKTNISSQEEFREAQNGVLRTVCRELAPRPRLPLQTELQAPVISVREALPRGLESILGSETTSSFSVVVDWRLLRKLSARRFPGSGKAFAPLSTSSIQDFISMFGGGERVSEAVLCQTLDIAIDIRVDQPIGSAGVDSRRSGGYDGVSEKKCGSNLEDEVSGAGFGGALLHLLRLGSISTLHVVQVLFDRIQAVGEGGHQGSSTNSKVQGLMHLLDAVLSREYALYRSLSYFQREGRRCAGGSEVATSAILYPRGNSHVAKGRVWRAKDWMGIVPGWVWEELQKGQWDERQSRVDPPSCVALTLLLKQHQHNPREIKSAGSSVPSSVQDPLFSAIQVRIADGARLPPMLAPYWARSVVTMMLIPSQAISLVISMVEELCLGATYAGDVVPDLLADAFGAFEDAPSLPSTPTAATRPVFRGLPHPRLASLAGLQSAFGGEGALARFMLPLSLSPSPPGYY